MSERLDFQLKRLTSLREAYQAQDDKLESLELRTVALIKLFRSKNK